MIIVSGRYPDWLSEKTRYSLENMEQARKMAKEMVYVGYVKVMIGNVPFTETAKGKVARRGGARKAAPRQTSAAC